MFKNMKFTLSKSQISFLALADATTMVQYTVRVGGVELAKEMRSKLQEFTPTE
jgi:hypothetical protein